MRGAGGCLAFSTSEITRRVVSPAMAAVTKAAMPMPTVVPNSVPAVMPCAVAVRNSGKLRKWILRHADFGMCLRSFDWGDHGGKLGNRTKARNTIRKSTTGYCPGWGNGRIF